MAFSWDWLVSALILLWLSLIIAAAVTKQTIPELIVGIKDALMGTADEVTERGEVLLYNE